MSDIMKFQYGDETCTQGPYKYTKCGLEDIYLLNGYLLEQIDGEDYITISDIEGLHKAIGKHLAMHRKALSPDEIRFLRKTMDMTQAELAAKMSNNVQSLARWESGKYDIPGPAEKFLRVIFLASVMTNDELLDFKDFLSSKIDELDEQDVYITPKAQFELYESWEEKAIAA